MDKNETTEALAAIGMMLQAFPSAQSSITADSPRVYLFAVEEFEIEALKRACRAIVRGEVKDLNPDFPPAAPKLAQIVKDYEGKLKVERFDATHTFVESDTELWEKMKLLLNDRSLLSVTRTFLGGRMRTGWSFDNGLVAQARQLSLPPPPTEAQMASNRERLRHLGFTAGDHDGDAELA